MTSPKSWRARSTPEQIDEAIKRAVRALKGSSTKITPELVSHRAAVYVPESNQLILRIIRAKTEKQLEDAGFPPEKTAVEVPKTRPVRPLSRWR